MRQNLSRNLVLWSKEDERKGPVFSFMCSISRRLYEYPSPWWTWIAAGGARETTASMKRVCLFYLLVFLLCGLNPFSDCGWKNTTVIGSFAWQHKKIVLSISSTGKRQLSLTLGKHFCGKIGPKSFCWLAMHSNAIRTHAINLCENNINISAGPASLDAYFSFFFGRCWR